MTRTRTYEGTEADEPDRVRFLVLDLWHPDRRAWTRVTVGEADPRWEGKCPVQFVESEVGSGGLVWMTIQQAEAVVEGYRSEDRVLHREAVVWVDGPCTHKIEWTGSPCCKQMIEAASRQVSPDPTRALV